MPRVPFESTVGESDLVIGQEYFGSIVRKVKQEVVDKGGKYRIKRFVTLKTGVILIEEYIRERTLGEAKNKEYGGGQFDDEEPKDDSAARAQARALLAKSKDEKPDKNKKKNKKRIEPEPDLDAIYDVPARVLPASKLPFTLDDDAPVTGAWRHNDGTDDTDWEPMAVVITKDPPSFLEPGEPHGIVAMKKGAKPNAAGKVHPSDLKFFAPGAEPPSSYKRVGHWTPGKLNQKWPPVKPEPNINLRNVGKLNLPDFDGEFAKVVPESQVPETQEEDAPLTGVWKHADGTDDANWEPMFVDITKDPPQDLGPEEAHGIVAVKDGTEPNETGNLDPSDLKFFPPGEEPPPDYNKAGHWRPGKLNQEWPPVKPKPKRNVRNVRKLTLPDFDNVDATIVPKSKLPKTNGEYAPLTGLWKHNDGTVDTDWDPMDVIITKEPHLFLEPGEPCGVVAVEEGAKPNKVGTLDPSDLKFFTPGEQPPPKYNKVGHWRPAKLNQEWPPIELVLPDFDGLDATIVPKSKAPVTQGSDGPLTGVWKHNDGTDDTDLDPMDVVIRKKLPLDLNSGEPHGVVAVEDGVKPNKVGTLDPSDLKFFTPREKLPPKYNKVGHWRPAKLNQDWPPSKPKLPNFDGPAKVVPKSKAPLAQGSDGPLTGVWKHSDDTDDTDWDPMDVIISKEPASFLEPGEPNGIVAVEDGVKPNKVGTLDPSDLKFFTPREKLPPKYNKVGHWRPAKLNQDWPPSKPKLPNFDGPAKVVPKSKAPLAQGSDAPTGVWKHSDDTDDTDWDPMDVIISKEPASFLEPREPNGIVAVEEGAKPNKAGTLDPSDLKFFTPGEKLPPKYNKVGHWRPGKLNQDWPPSKPKPPVKPPSKRIVRDFEKPALPSFDGSFAKVFPVSKLHERSKKDPPLAGVWKHSDDTDDTDWEPMGVIITKDPPSDLDEDEFHGIVAVVDGVKPDKTGKLDPFDLKFFTPGEELPPKYNEVGHWRPGNKVGWPPVKPSTARSLRNVGKLNLPSFDGIPDLGVIYPRSQAPDTHDETKGQIIAKGIWKWSKLENKPKDSEAWVPSNVELYEDGNEPHDWDDNQTNGVWGVNPNVDAKVNTKPSDLWFYPPNEKTDEGFEPIGKWRPSKKLVKEVWSYPPKSVGRVEDKRQFKEFERSQNSVGKLRMPSFFKNK